MLRDVSSLDPSTTLFGRPMAMPLIVAPTGYTRIAHSQGELAVARAAARAGLPYSLSTMGTRSIEEVAAVSDGDKWFQVYTWRDRGLVADLVGRAKAAGYTTLWLTVDTAVLGRRERDVRRGFALPPKIGLETIIDGAIHPGWTWDFLRNDPIMFANVVGHGDQEDGKNPISLAAHVNSQFDQALSWADIDWLRTMWDGPIVLKGIQTVADAKQAVALGVEGIGLSNHGGRQLDDAPVPVELVEPVRQEIGDQAAIICDGGVRRGSDVVQGGRARCRRGVDRSGLPVRARRRRRARRRPRPRVLPGRLRAHDGAHRMLHRRRHRSRPRPLAHLKQTLNPRLRRDLR